MTNKVMPRYPIYIPSKSRHDCCYTAKFLIKDEVPFKIVVEPHQKFEYASVFGEERLLVLPFKNKGSVVPARNWIKEHSTTRGDKRHWQIDDNIRYMVRWYKGQRIRCSAGVALRAIEDFVDRYTNVAIAGPAYEFFAISRNLPPFYLNTHVYSCTLVLNEIPHRWRGRYNEDTDICLQVLADGWCTVQMLAFLQKKSGTMTMKGGNTDELYRYYDGRLKMARSLERKWPGVVKTSRRFGRPQHIVYDAWRRFDTPLKRRDDIDWEALEKQGTNEYGMELKKVDDIESEEIRELYEERKKDEASPDDAG